MNGRIREYDIMKIRDAIVSLRLSNWMKTGMIQQ